jgi:RNase adaptor protein for sRNA GlmZ degradation
MDWGQGIALVLLAVFLEAVVDYIVDRYKVTRRKDHDNRRSH